MKKLCLIVFMLAWSIRPGFSQTFCALVTLPDKSHAYIDRDGKILYKESPDLELDEQIFPVSDGLGRIRRKDKFGFVDCNGKIVIPIVLDKAQDFHEGLTAVCDKGKWCYMDTQGKVAIPERYKNIHKFCGGLAIVEKNGNYGYINVKGELVIPATFDRVSYFRNHRAWVLSEGHWGCIDEKGNYILKPYYKDTQDFSEGYAWVEKDNAWGLIDSTGKYVIAPDERNPLIYAQSATYKNFGKFNSGRMISVAYNKFGYCDVTAKKVIASTFDRAYDFEHGMARVSKDGLWGMIDPEGKFIVQPLYLDIKYAGDNIFAVKVKGGLWGLVDKDGTWLVSPAYKAVYALEQIND